MKYFNFKFLIMLLALAMAIPSAWAENAITVCDGTTTNTYLPFYGQGYYLQNNQMIYPASMLSDIAGKDITGITFYSKSAMSSGATYDVALGTTTQSTYSSATAITGLSTVATGKTLSTSGSEVVIEFDEPFAYDGSNLVVEITVTGNGSYNSNTFYGVSQESSSFYYYSYSSGYWSGYVQSFLPKATFAYGDPQPYAASVKPSSINFGKTIPGGSITQNITVKNLGTNPFTPSISGLSAPFSTSYTPAELAQGESATVPIVYAPTTTGMFEGTAQVSFSAGDIAPVNISLTGSCVNEVTICEGSATNEKVPFYGTYNDVLGTTSQVIYPASKLTLLDGKTITGLTFYTDNSGILFSGGTTTVTMGFIDETEFTNQELFTIDGTVATATITPVAGGTEITITFEQGLEYVEGKNLIIQTEVTQTGSYKSTSFVGEEQNYNCAYNNKTYYGALMAFLPKVTFAYTEDAVVATPELAVDPEELILDAEHNSFEVLGSNLKGDVTITVDNENFTVTPTTISKADAEQGATVTVTYTGTDVDGELATITVASQDAESATVSVMGAAPKPVLIADPDALDLDEATTFTVMGENLQGDVTLSIDNENFTVTPTTISKADAEDGATVTVAYAGTNTEGEEANITIKSAKADNVTVYVIGKAAAPVVVDAPTFDPEAGSYTEAQTVTITCPTEGAVVSYSTDGGASWTQGNTVTVDKDMTLMAKAEKGTTVTTASAVYSFEFPVEPITIEPITGYFKVKNNGNSKYVNIAGRKTMKFTNDIDTNAGTVIRVETDNHGQVQVLRSQAADLQGYANRAMKYVPEIVQIVANKLHAEGDGALLGDEGLKAIMDKFNESFDYHLYVEPAEGGYRLYGKTPSMQPVVEFYREHTHQVDTKLPMLEGFINDAIQKLLEKTGGRGESILQPFSLHETWERMGGTLTEPVDSSSTMAFYHQVLMNKDYVWSFAYETAMTYWERVKAHPRYEELKDELGEFANYIDEIEQVRPNFKYYVVADGNGPDFISEGNKDIKNNEPRTLWTLEARTDFKVNIPAEYIVDGEYVTTLYTDFAYTLPEGVTAYKVINVNSFGDAELEAIGNAVPVQTPILLKATEAGMKTLTLNTADGAPIDGNLLKGPDYLIKTYQIKTPQVETLFNMVKNILGEQFYNDNVAQYEHLMLKTAGTVNNKYFWGLPYNDVKNCIYINENDEGECVVRSLDIEDGIVAFYNNATVSTNKAFLVSEEHNTINLTLHGDINRNGAIEVGDVSALIDILLSLPERPYVEPDSTYPRGLDYVAADFNNDGEISIKDVSVLIDYLLNK